MTVIVMTNISCWWLFWLYWLFLWSLSKLSLWWWSVVAFLKSEYVNHKIPIVNIVSICVELILLFLSLSLLVVEFLVVHRLYNAVDANDIPSIPTTKQYTNTLSNWSRSLPLPLPLPYCGRSWWSSSNTEMGAKLPKAMPMPSVPFPLSRPLMDNLPLSLHTPLQVPLPLSVLISLSLLVVVELVLLLVTSMKTVIFASNTMPYATRRTHQHTSSFRLCTVLLQVLLVVGWTLVVEKSTAKEYNTHSKHTKLSTLQDILSNNNLIPHHASSFSFLLLFYSYFSC